MRPSLYLVASITVLFADAPQSAPAEIQPNRSAALTESEVFEQARRSVFVVETESGYGSGFLVDDRGLVITNDHVIGRTSYLAVSVDSKRKYPAVVVARDTFRDIAVIRVDPRAIAGLEPLRFEDSGNTATVGERILAIGSALTGNGVLTTGIVSRLEAETIIADLNVNAGSSGGPLLNLNGEVVGVCTFYIKAPAGPGLAGIVRAPFVRAIFAKAARALSLESPPFEALPVASSIPYPASALPEMAATIRSPSDYGTTIGSMRIDVLTPPLVYFEAHQVEMRQAHKARARYSWHAFNGDVEAIIGIRAVPAVTDLAADRIDEGAAGSNVIGGRRGQFTTDVREIRLLRDGVDVVPIVPGRFCTRPEEAALHRPAGCFGLYQYPPSAFAPGAELEVRVYSDQSTKPRAWHIPPKVITRVWADFAPWLVVAGCPAPCARR